MLPIADETKRKRRDGYREGIDARLMGVARRACPYPAGTVQQIDWLAGWHDEDRVIAARCADPSLREDRAA